MAGENANGLSIPLNSTKSRIARRGGGLL